MNSAPNLHTLHQQFGGDLYDGGRRLVMPGPGHSRHDRSLSVMINDRGRAIYHSFANEPHSVVSAYLGLPETQDQPQSVREAKLAQEDRKRLAALERASKLAFCQRVWGDTLPAESSPVETYLAGRGIIGPIPDAIRFHAAAPLGYQGSAVYTAMVAIVTGPDGKSSGLHVTAIKPDGSGKPDMTNPRRMFGDMRGAAVRFAPVPVNGVLGLSEGLETGLSYSLMTGLAVWACLSTSGLRNFTPPSEVKRLVVAADGDRAGLEAAAMLVERSSRRCACAVAAAPEGQDWNDVLMMEVAND
ncbi:DUF7146 domain-containing protein [Phenylobacterium sp.]|uniref:DUF7146 domain-containing protein n=1 Tax=Phenylobacterium sp. TaxID=1871053 RepID=UPI003BA8B2C2